jgi:hypothetical protein
MLADDYEMEIEGDSFLDYNAPTQPINRNNS